MTNQNLLWNCIDWFFFPPVVWLDHHVKQGHSRLPTDMKPPSVKAIFRCVMGTSWTNIMNHSREKSRDLHKTNIFSLLFASSPKKLDMSFLLQLICIELLQQGDSLRKKILRHDILKTWRKRTGRKDCGSSDGERWEHLVWKQLNTWVSPEDFYCVKVGQNQLGVRLTSGSSFWL